MSKGARKTGGQLRRAQSRDASERACRIRTLKTTVLIVGAGKETEPNYFDGMRRESAVAQRFSVTVKGGPGQSPEHVVDFAVQEKDKADRRGAAYDEVWCLLDVENPSQRRTLVKALSAAREHGICVCLSNPCFEVWLLAHFEKSAPMFNGYRDVAAALNRHWRKRFEQDYDKADERLHARVKALTETAVDNARWAREKHHGLSMPAADCNSCTEVYRLVQRLIAGAELPVRSGED